MVPYDKARLFQVSIFFLLSFSCLNSYWVVKRMKKKQILTQNNLAFQKGKEIGAWKNIYSKNVGFNWGIYFKIL